LHLKNAARRAAFLFAPEDSRRRFLSGASAKARLPRVV
jgi:hypothetical protein